MTSFVARIGSTSLTSGEMTVEWSIDDFFSLSDKVGDSYKSSIFSFADSWWYLKLYPNGDISDCCGYLSLFLMRGDSGPSKTVHYTLGIKNSDEEDEEKDEEEHEEKECVRKFSEEDSGFGFPKFWSRSKIQNQASTLMPENILIITCHLKCDPTAIKISLSNRVWEVKSNLKTILDDGERADFTLKLGDREWPVHKVILESRCEYFKNMFRHDWIENTVGEVKFEDIEEDALGSVLQFIYTGEVEDMTVEEVCDIYVAAHKFLLDDLKALCLQYMKENVCLEIVCKVLVIADTYGEKDLNERAIEYCMQETDYVLESEEWKELEKNNITVAAALMKETTKRLTKRMNK